MTESDETVYLVDDDEAVRESLVFLLKSAGVACSPYASAEAFLTDFSPDMNGCLILDIRMPGINGMELQTMLIERNCQLPIIFITGHGDIEMAVETMRLGAFDFIQKPFHDNELLERIQLALGESRREQDEQRNRQAVQERLESLTPREQEVMARVVAGQANKVIAIDLGLSQRTVEVHRARVMEKMHARSLAELVRMALLVE